MSDLKKEPQNDFMIEKIKERPVDKKKLLKRMMFTVLFAVVFGLVACFTFLVLEPIINNWLYPEEKPQTIVFPEDVDEMSPEDMLAETLEEEEDAFPEIEQVEELLSGIVLNKTHYEQIYQSMSQYVDQLEQSMVTITGTTSNLDWLNNVQEMKKQASGVIIANNGRDLMILADYVPLQGAEKLTALFFEGTVAEAQIKQKDSATNTAIITVNLNDLSQQFLEENLKIATLGTSNLKNLVGIPVVAIGSPMGKIGSIGYGMIASISEQVPLEDVNCKLLQTNIAGSRNAGGVLFNMQGQVLGVITGSKKDDDMQNLVTAYGITDLKRRIEKMSNGEQIPYLGISGLNVTTEAHDTFNIPYGAYVKEIEMDSPARKAGIQQGDVITAVGNRSVLTFNEYSALLMQKKVGETMDLTLVRMVQGEYVEMTVQPVLEEAK